MGGGDIKLMAACGAVLTVPALFEAAAWTAILGAILAVLARSFALVRKTKVATIPYAPAIVTGAWLTLWVRVYKPLAFCVPRAAGHCLRD